jgi:hypothetical protein
VVPELRLLEQSSAAKAVTAVALQGWLLPEVGWVDRYPSFHWRLLAVRLDWANRGLREEKDLQGVLAV